MNDDLIDWFAEANGFSGGTKAPHKWVLQAEQELRIHAAALEAAATIARQQVMLDRALESNGDMQAQVARLRIALEDIIVASNNSGLEMGTVGMRVAERVEDIARAALEAKHG